MFTKIPANLWDRLGFFHPSSLSTRLTTAGWVSWWSLGALPARSASRGAQPVDRGIGVPTAVEGTGFSVAWSNPPAGTGPRRGDPPRPLSRRFTTPGINEERVWRIGTHGGARPGIPVSRPTFEDPPG